MKTSPFLGVGLLSLLGWSNLNALTTLNGDHLIAPSGSELGSLELGGILSVGGNSFEFGTVSGGGPGVIWTYYDSSTAPVLAADIMLSNATYAWRQVVSGQSVSKMTLGGTNVLELYAPGYSTGSPTNGLIKLTPATSANGGSEIHVNGQRVLTLADSALFVTQSTGVVNGKLSVTGNLTTHGGVVLSGSPSYNPFAWGVAIGPESQAAPDGGIALGRNAKAWGAFSFASGVGTTAGGYSSTATGHGTTANKHHSFAAGKYTETHAEAQFAVGVNNINDAPANNTYTILPTDAAFVVGNGSSQISSLLPNAPKSNAFVVRYSGDTEMKGNATVVKSATVQQNLTVTGNVTTSGAISGTTASFSGRVRLAPKGGISMGEFTYEP